MSDLSSSVVEYVRVAALSDRYAAYLRNTLVELAGIDTSLDRKDLAAQERALFDLLAGEVRAMGGASASIEHEPVDSHGGERGRLIVRAPSQVDPAMVVQANVDTGSPWFVHRPVGERVFGCGVCRNKGQVAVLVAQMKLMAEVAERVGQGPSRGCVYRFVVEGGSSDNESGGGANLPAMVFDCTDRTPCCGQHGLVRYRCRLTAPQGTGFSAVELFPMVVLGLETEGREIGGESISPPFRADRVRHNIGLLGGFGSKPVTACAHVALEIEAYARAKPERVSMIVTQLLDAAMVQYVDKFGDKTREIDPATGQPMLDRHFAVDLKATAEASIVRIDVWGCGGHMAAAHVGDNAITKAAFLLGALLRVAPQYPDVRAIVRLSDDTSGTREIVLAGAQSFALPLKAKNVQERLTAAATKGLQQYGQLRGCKFDPGMIEMTFDDADSEAYAGLSDSVPVQALRQAFAALNEPWPGLTAWVGDCDARRYHVQGSPVAIFGAGKLETAYGSNEYVDIPDLQKTLAISTLAAWLMTG